MTAHASTLAQPFTLAVCAEMIFLDLPFIERVKRLDELGFQVEIWDWTQKDITALQQTGAVFSSMTGYIDGRLSDDEGAERLLATARESIPVAKALGIPRLNLHGTGLGEGGLPVTPCHHTTGTMWMKAKDTLSHLAELGDAHGVTFVLENLNLDVDHPGVPFARASEVLELVSAVNRPSMKMMLDIYHAQIGAILHNGPTDASRLNDFWPSNDHATL